MRKHCGCPFHWRTKRCLRGISMSAGRALVGEFAREAVAWDQSARALLFSYGWHGRTKSRLGELSPRSKSY